MNVYKLMDEVVSLVQTVDVGVKERVKMRSLTPTQFKLFCTVLERTKHCVEAAKDHSKRKPWNALFGDKPP